MEKREPRTRDEQRKQEYDRRVEAVKALGDRALSSIDQVLAENQIQFPHSTEEEA